MFLKNVSYIKSCPSKEFYPSDDRKEICIVGRSNVGKSSFINFICNNSTIAKVSSQPGYTKYLNFFDVNNSFYLVDSPGYGYSKTSKDVDNSFNTMMGEYLNDRDNLICVIMIVDSLVGLTSDDINLYQSLKDGNLDVQIFASKCDKLNQSKRHSFLTKSKEYLTTEDFNNIILYSILDKKYQDKVCERILSIYNK